MRHELFRFSGNYIPRAAILIQRVGNGTHTGVIYRGESGELRLLEFFLGGEIGSKAWKGRYPHVILDPYDDDALDNLSSLCRVIAKRYNNKSSQHLFAFKRSPTAYIDIGTGELYLGEAAGATCASFVLLVTSSALIKLVKDGPDWPYRPDVDDPAHERLLGMIAENYPGDVNRLEKAKAELPCPRVAPEEVAGAAMSPAPPADQAFAERAARWIVELLDHNQKHNV